MSQNFLFANRYKLMQRFAVSGNIELWKAEDIKTKDIITLKLSAENSDAYSNAQLLKEYLILTQIRHPNLLTPLHYDDEQGQPYLVFPYTEGSSLKHIFLHQPPANENEAKKMLHSIADALSCLHEQQIFHRNIHPANIFLLRGQYLLGAFKRQSDSSLLQNAALLPYAAPELLNESAAYSAQSDIYALGVVVYELCTHQLPHRQLNENKSLHLPASFSLSFKETVASCLSLQPNLRPSAAQLIQQSGSYDFNDFCQQTSTIDEPEKIKTGNIVSDKEILTAVVAKTITITTDTPVIDDVSAKNEHPNIRYERKKVNLLLACACLALLLFIGATQLFSGGKNKNDKNVVTQNHETNEANNMDPVESPSKYLNINNFKPDTIDYTEYENNMLPDVTPKPIDEFIPFKGDNGFYGFKNEKGKKIIASIYEDVFAFSEGLAAVKYEGEWGYINQKGRWAIQPKFDKAGVFSNEQAKVEYKGNSFTINKSGNCIENCISVSQIH
jgi:serine/threonine protein kinase